MVNNDHTQQYSAADIQRYLDGNMPAADMHALEKAALDDPFLADAIEGMQQTLEQHDAHVIATNLQDLNRQVAARTKKEDKQTRVIAFRWWQIAAAAVVVVIAGIGVYRYSGRSESKELALTDKEIAQVKPPVSEERKAVTVPATEAETHADSVAIVAAPLTATNEKTIDLKKTKASRYKKQFTPKNDTLLYSFSENKNNTALSSSSYSLSTATTQANTAEVPPIGGIIKFDSADLPYAKLKKAPVVAARQQTEYEQIVIPKTKRDSLAKDYYSKPRADLAMNPSKKELSELSDKQLSRELKKNPNALLSGYIKGRVSDQFNNPLYNAVVRVEDQRDFLTDKQGYFQIPANDSLVKVAVGYNGFYTQNLQLQNNTRDNRITLNQLGIKPPNPALNNVMVKSDTVDFNSTAFKARSATSLAKAYALEGAMATVQSAQPEYGWLEYHQYLDKNKKAPSEDTLTGKVVVSFEVSKKGSLSDFKIEQSLRKDYDEEAIRLIKAGPSWKLISGHKARATIIVNF